MIVDFGKVNHNDPKLLKLSQKLKAARIKEREAAKLFAQQKNLRSEKAYLKAAKERQKLEQKLTAKYW